MAQFHNGITIGPINDIREEQWGHDAARITLPGISSCTGVVIVTNGGLVGLHLTIVTEAARVAALCARAAAHLGGNALSVNFIGFMNFNTPTYNGLGTQNWHAQTAEVVGLLGLPAATARNAYLMGAESDLRVTRAHGGALTYELSNHGGWNPLHCLPI